MKHNIFTSLLMGLEILALLFVFAGCPSPVDSPNIPEEIPTGEIEQAADPGTGETPVDPGHGDEEPGEKPKDPPEIPAPDITGFSFLSSNLTYQTAGAGTVAGSFSAIQGGTAPFVFTLEIEEGAAENDKFEVNGAALKIKGSGLTAGVYRAHLQVQDSKGKVFNKAVEFRVSVPSQMINMITVPGGAYQIKESDSPSPQLVTKTVTGFKMAETETTQELWTAVMGYNPSIYINNSLGPVDHLNWYDAITFCNRLSIAMGKTPVYAIDGIDFRTITYEQIPTELSTASIIDLWNSVTINSAADGYRLPGKYEWFWASMGADSDNPGAVNETGYLKAYAGASGTNSAGINDYAWPNITTHPVGLLLPNELGFFDMTGNAAEWFWELIDQYASQNHYLSGFTGMYITYTSSTDGRFRTNGMNGIRLACNL